MEEHQSSCLTETSETGEMDRISHLPDSIVHHILSFLRTLDKELVRMSVLSKTWFHLTASFPVLDFRIHNVTHLSRKSFFKYVDYTTSRFCHQNLIAHTFKLVTNLLEPAELDIVNGCLHLLFQNGVRKLEIDFSDYTDYTNSSYVPKYCLPNTLLSISVLRSLTIYGCDLPSSLMVDTIKFKSLVYLELARVCIDDEVINYITTSCSLLQVLRIKSCPGFKRFCVHGHQHLQRVFIYYDTPVEIIDIATPNLYCLSIMDINGRGVPRMNVASCKKLTTVVYFGNPLLNSNGFSDFLSNFPFIKTFFLFSEYKCNNLILSSHSLRTLVLWLNCDLEEIEFRTPKLVSFSYTCSFSRLSSMVMDKHWDLLRDSTHLKACMHCYPGGYIDTLWFQKLRQFLDKKNGFKVFNLYIDGRYSQEFIELEKLKEIKLPPYELELVVLQLETREESPAHVAFVDAVLWCCLPRSLTLRSSSPLTALDEQSDVVKFTYEKLLQQEDQGRTNIQIVSPSFSSLSMALPLEGKAISFIKEEVLQEEAGSQRFAGLEIV